jgi:hypothetical protein
MLTLPELDVKRNRSRLCSPRVLALANSFGIITIMSICVSSSTAHRSIAHAARTLNITATAHLHLVKAEGSQLVEEGSVSGALAGSMRAELKTGSVFTGSFTTHLRGGSISGRGKANPHGSGRYQSFSGSFVVTSGSGRYTHVNGHAGLYGVFDRRSDSVIVQTTGKLSY